MDYSKNAYGVAGDDLGSSEKNRSRRSKKAHRSLCYWHNSLISPSPLLVLAMATSAVGQQLKLAVVAVLASFGCSSLRLLLSQRAQSELLGAAETLGGILAGGGGKVPGTAGIRSRPDGSGQSRRANRAGERASRRDVWISARRFVGATDGHLGPQEASGRVFGISNRVSESATRLFHGKRPWRSMDCAGMATSSLWRSS